MSSAEVTSRSFIWVSSRGGCRSCVLGQRRSTALSLRDDTLPASGCHLSAKPRPLSQPSSHHPKIKKPIPRSRIHPQPKRQQSLSPPRRSNVPQVQYFRIIFPAKFLQNAGHRGFGGAVVTAYEHRAVLAERARVDHQAVVHRVQRLKR